MFGYLFVTGALKYKNCEVGVGIMSALVFPSAAFAQVLASTFTAPRKGPRRLWSHRPVYHCALMLTLWNLPWWQSCECWSAYLFLCLQANVVVVYIHPPALLQKFDTAIHAASLVNEVCTLSPSLSFFGNCLYSGHCQPFMVSLQCCPRIFLEASIIFLPFNKRDEAPLSFSYSLRNCPSRLCLDGSCVDLSTTTTSTHLKWQLTYPFLKCVQHHSPVVKVVASDHQQQGMNVEVNDELMEVGRVCVTWGLQWATETWDFWFDRKFS